jgi:hypothetical protein
MPFIIGRPKQPELATDEIIYEYIADPEDLEPLVFNTSEDAMLFLLDNGMNILDQLRMGVVIHEVIKEKE